MNEAEYFIKNYGDRGGGCYPSRQLVEEDNILLDLHFLHVMLKPNSIIVLLFIQK